MLYDVCIIGGGASGLMAAYRLAAAGVNVALVEQADRVGKKLLATGNGRCNIMNVRVSPERWYSRDTDAAAAILGACPIDRLMSIFGELGLILREEDAGRVYPASGSAASVLDALRLSVAERGADVICETKVTGMRREHGAWRVSSPEGEICTAARLILATGGSAQPTSPKQKAGRGLDALGALKALGHRVYAPEPMLVPLKCDTRPIRGLKGVRVKGRFELIDADGAPLAAEKGELLFTEYGVSGVAAMQLSRAYKAGCALRLDLIPELSEAELSANIAKRAADFAGRDAANLLAGALHRLLAAAVLRQAGIAPDERCGDIDDGRMKALTHNIKALTLTGVARQEFDMAQVMRGGAALCDFDAHLMSRRVPELYAVGELLDVDGECGGYNLMWAWASAIAASDGIIEECHDKNNRRQSAN